jgi:hypothetical protein
LPLIERITMRVELPELPMTVRRVQARLVVLLSVWRRR